MSKKKNIILETGNQRSVANKRYNKIFFIATEGVRTEPAYFEVLDSLLQKSNQTKTSVIPTKNSNSSPKRLAKNMQQYLTKNKLRSLDEAWIVCDSDGRAFEVLEPVLTFQNSSKQRYVAITNPKFEYWLLLHFEDGKGVRTSSECTDRLKKYLPTYDKSLSTKSFDLQKVKKAVSFLEKKVLLSNEALIEQVGTTVHVLVKKIIDSE